MPHLSIVTTLYKSKDFIQEFYKRTVNSASQITGDYEIIFVDDGSPDNSSQVVKDLIQKDKRVRLIELSRNFGHYKAMIVALRHAKGEFIFLIDSDLEENPEILINFYDLMQKNNDIDVVYGCLRQRRGNFLQRIPGTLFYKVLNFLSDVCVPENTLFVRLMRKSYVESFLRFKESHVFILGLLKLAGFKQVAIPVEKSSKGKTAYTFFKKLSLALDGITSFSNRPLVCVSLLGLLISFISFLLVFFLVFNRLIFSHIITGWTSVMVSLWFIGGLIITSIGIVGLYIGKIFIQVKNRPNTIVRNIYN